jgi:sulfoacetaldehyde dehydrogenase
MLAKPVGVMCELAGITRKAACDADFLMVEETGVGADFPFSGEKMALVLTLYRAQDFDHAKQMAGDILNYQGKGHSLSLHSQSVDRAEILGLEMPVCRVIVNQPHCFAAGGSFDNGLPFSLSMGCGTWGGNVTDQNVHYRHFMNVTKVVQTIAAREVSVEDIFADYRRRYLS